MTPVAPLNRRVFLKTASSSAAALVIGFYLPREGFAQAAAAKPAPNPFDAWVHIAASGQTTILMPKSEMGQGVMTGLPMIIAEELEADWKNVRVEQAPTNPDIYRHGTGGSTSSYRSWLPMRQAGAAAREMLLTAAAQSWSVSRDECIAKSGAVLHPPSHRRKTYAELVDAASKLPIPDLEKVPLKKSEDFTIVGKDTLRVDAAIKTNGSAKYGIDTRVPGMLFAVVARPPAYGGKLLRVDSRKAKAVAGVRDVVSIAPLPDFFTKGGVAVVADSSWAAMEGRRALQVEWDPGPNANESSESLRQQFLELAGNPGAVVRNDGDADAVLSRAGANKHEAVYELPFAAHATMEPMNCTVHVRADSAEAWAPTQDSADARDTIVKITGLRPEAVTVHTTFMGGGFGRRSMADYVAEATQVSKAVNRPVQVLFSREDDIQHDMYRPAFYHRMAAAFDEKKNLLAWKHFLTSPSVIAFLDPSDAKPAGTEIGGAAHIPYAVPNYRIEYALAKSGVPRTWWRSVEESSSGFVVESFVDELAHAAKEDPLEFRLRLMGERRVVPYLEYLGSGEPLECERMKNVLRMAATQAGWGQPLPKGSGRGIACFFCYHTYVALVAQVSVRQGTVRVEHTFVAVDCGQPINPEGVRLQAESAVIYGMTAALKGPITIKNGAIEQSNFDDYEMLRINEAPKIDVQVVASREKPTGVGEPMVAVVAPALGNAMFAATGKRIRRLPIRAEDLG